MIHVFFSENSIIGDEESTALKILSLPENIQQSINRYKNSSDKKARLNGKLILNDFIKQYNLNNSNAIEYLLYNESGKPTIPNLFFSLAYSNDITVLSASLETDNGIDIEKIKPINLDEYKDYLSDAEWLYINASSDPNSSFYYIWTRKEAILKILGNGISDNMNLIEVINHIVQLNNNIYYLQSIDIHPQYCCNVATLNKADKVQICIREM